MSAIAFHEFDHSRRHCWELKDGTYIIDTPNKPDATNDDDWWNWEPPKEEFCTEWRNHPEKAGNTQFIRWIRNFTTLTGGKITGTNSPEGNLKLGVQWCDTYKADIFCEDYGGQIKCFLDAANGVAVVEIYDEKLLEAAEQATILTEKEYEDMLNVAGNPA